ncbi:MAG: Calx-beta domain-containing protein, partial [Isosphaeraceae bacterium]
AVLTINNNMPPILQFSSNSYTTYAGSSFTIVSVTRGGGSRGTAVQVQYAAAGGSAAAGVDYTPVTGTLTFLANQTTATFTVPILNGGVAPVTSTVGLVLSGPTAGAQLGPISTATLTIMAGSPYNPVGQTDTVPPQITGEQLVLGSTGITAVLFSFSQPLNPSRVPDLGNYGYYVDVAGANGVFGTSADIYVPLSSAQYNPATSTVTVIPSTPLPLNRFERITIDGLANPLLGRGLIDTSGVLLSGLGNGVPGSPFIATFSVGSSLAYSDSLGKTVQISTF